MADRGRNDGTHKTGLTLDESCVFCKQVTLYRADRYAKPGVLECLDAIIAPLRMIFAQLIDGRRSIHASQDSLLQSAASCDRVLSFLFEIALELVLFHFSVYQNIFNLKSSQKKFLQYGVNQPCHQFCKCYQILHPC